jgi:hypothetical protein
MEKENKKIWALINEVHNKGLSSELEDKINSVIKGIQAIAWNAGYNEACRQAGIEL